MKYCAELPESQEYDVVVVGGGTAGAVAAIAAARNGATTLLLERTCALGGNLTQGLVQNMHGYRLHAGYETKNHVFDWSTPLMIKQGLAIEVFTRLQEAQGAAFSDDHRGDPSLREIIDEEIMTQVLIDMCEEAGVQILFDTYAFDVVKEDDGTVIGVVGTNKSGAQLFRGKVIVDCSADADIAVKAGAEYELGDELGRTHGVCLRTEFGGIDIDRFLEYLRNRPAETQTPEYKAETKRLETELINGGSPSEKTVSYDGTEVSRREFDMRGKQNSPDMLLQLKEEGKFLSLSNTINREWVDYLLDHPYPETPYQLNTTTEKPCYPRQPLIGYFGMVRHGKVRYDQNMLGVFENFVDCTDGYALSETILNMRKINEVYLKFFRERIPGFEDAYIIKTAPLYGARESRRIVGEYKLTEEEAKVGFRPADSVGISCFANSHHLGGPYGIKMFMQPKTPFGISYRCFIPKGLKNVLVAGRPFSREFIVRCTGMPNCMMNGESIGMAAAIAATSNIDVRDVDVTPIQKVVGIDIDEQPTEQ